MSRKKPGNADQQLVSAPVMKIDKTQTAAGSQSLFFHPQIPVNLPQSCGRFRPTFPPNMRDSLQMAAMVNERSRSSATLPSTCRIIG